MGALEWAGHAVCIGRARDVIKMNCFITGFCLHTDSVNMWFSSINIFCMFIQMKCSGFTLFRDKQ
jgi:hypothetical protein